jgi:tetratricopeptide (TPR) repeat protein
MSSLLVQPRLLQRRRHDRRNQRRRALNAHDLDLGADRQRAGALREAGRPDLPSELDTPSGLRDVGDDDGTAPNLCGRVRLGDRRALIELSQCPRPQCHDENNGDNAEHDDLDPERCTRRCCNRSRERPPEAHENNDIENHDLDKAEGYLRRVVEARPTDADALYQYGRALGLLGNLDAAIASFEKARALAPGRAEIGLELALTYERNRADDSAGALFGELVARDDASLEARGRAGAFYVRTHQMSKAGEQGAKIVAQDPEHAAGHYLKGEGLYGQGRWDDARKELGEAVRLERAAVYLDAQGHATEQAALEHKDTALEDQALRAYQAATELEPTLFDPLRGAGRIYVHRREHAKALGPLLAAQQLRANDPEVAFLIGASYQELGGDKRQLAIKWLELSLRTRPDGEAAYLLGQLYQDEDINKPVDAQRAFAIAVRLWTKQEQATGAVVPELSKAMYAYGRMSMDRHDEATAKYAWERWIARDDADRRSAAYQEVVRLLATSLKAIGPPPAEK